MSQILSENSFWKVVFLFLAEKLILHNFKWFFGRYFETERPLFNFFAAIGFWSTLEWLEFQRTLCSEKDMFLILGPYGSPLTTNGSTEDLDHLSINFQLVVSVSVSNFQGLGLERQVLGLVTERSRSWSRVCWSRSRLVRSRLQHWPQHCTTLHSKVLSTKFGRHRIFLSDYWPLVNLSLPLYDFWP